MKASIGRASDGWSSKGFVALMEDETTVMASSPQELMVLLRARGIKEHDWIISGSDDGDHSLSADQQAEIRAAWLASD